MNAIKYIFSLVLLGATFSQLVSPSVAGTDTIIAETRTTILPAVPVSAVTLFKFNHHEPGAHQSSVLVSTNFKSSFATGGGKYRRGRYVSDADVGVVGAPSDTSRVSFSIGNIMRNASGYTVSLNNFVSPNKYNRTGDNGRPTVRIGGTLYMSGRKPAGIYAGSVSITINFN